MITMQLSAIHLKRRIRHTAHLLLTFLSGAGRAATCASPPLHRRLAVDAPVDETRESVALNASHSGVSDKAIGSAQSEANARPPMPPRGW